MTNTFHIFQKSSLALLSVVLMIINCYRLIASKCQKLLKRINQKSKKSFFKIVVVVVFVVVVVVDVRLMVTITMISTKPFPYPLQALQGNDIVD